MILHNPNKKPFKNINQTWLGILSINCYLYFTFIFGNSPSFEFGHLGAEYANIAKSIVEGNGYANPFKYPTGVTSWMPPFLVYFKALVFSLFGYGNLSYWILTILKFSGFSLTYVVFIKISNKLKIGVNKLLFAFVYVVFLYLAKQDIIFLCIDHSFYNLMLSILLLFLVDFITEGKNVLILSLLYFLIPLSTPALFIPVVLLTVIVFIIYLLKIRMPEVNLTSNIKFKHFLYLGLAATISVLLWTYRNYKVFDDIILSKSNTWFEFYLSDIKDYEGVVHYSTHDIYHPYKDSLKCKEIEKLGEQKWLQQYKDSADVYKKEFPDEYKKKVWNRVFNIFIKLSFPNDNYIAEEKAKLTQNIKNTLCDVHLMQKNNENNRYSWICVYLTNQEFFNELKKVGLSNDYSVIKDFNYARFRYLEVKNSLTRLFLGLTLALLPFLSLIIFNVVYFKRRLYAILIVNVIYLVYFIPFILISYQNRYQELILSFQAYIVSVAAWGLIELMRNKFSVHYNKKV